MKSTRPYGHTLCRRLLITLFVLLSLGALTCTYLTATYLPQKAPDSLEITLPSLVGRDLNDSQSLLPDGYYDIIYEYRPDATAPPGTVLAQYPAAGSLRRTIPDRSPCPLRLVVSTGPKTYTLRSVIPDTNIVPKDITQSEKLFN